MVCKDGWTSNPFFVEYAQSNKQIDEMKKKNNPGINLIIIWNNAKANKTWRTAT